MKMIPIIPNMYVYMPADELLSIFARECGLPKDLKYWTVDKEKVYTMRPCYHNDLEEDVFTTDPEKVKLAGALKTLMKYFEKRG